MNFEHLTLSRIMETKQSFYSPYHSQVYPALEKKKSAERYKMKAIKFPVITVFSQIFLSDKPKRFISNRNCFQKGREANAINSNHSRGKFNVKSSSWYLKLGFAVNYNTFGRGNYIPNNGLNITSLD